MSDSGREKWLTGAMGVLQRPVGFPARVSASVQRRGGGLGRTYVNNMVICPDK